MIHLNSTINCHNHKLFGKTIESKDRHCPEEKVALAGDVGTAGMVNRDLEDPPQKRVALAGDVGTTGTVNRRRDYYSVHSPFSQKRQNMAMSWYIELRLSLMKSYGRLSLMKS